MSGRIDKRLYFFLLISVILLFNGILKAQVVWPEEETFSANNIEYAIISHCDFVFGEIDSCKIKTISKLDRDGNIIESTYSPGSSHESFSKYKFDSTGNRYYYTSISSGDTTTYLTDFDDSGRVLLRRKFKNNTLIDTLAYKYEDSKPILVEGYDTSGKLNYLVKHKYDVAGNEIETVVFNGTDTSIIRNEYDVKNRLIKTVYKNYSGEVSITKSFYDNDTIVMTKTIMQDGTVNSVKFKYDDKKRLIQKVYTYGGDQNQVTTLRYAYNEDNRIIKKSSSDNHAPGRLRVTYYTYDEAGMINSVLTQRESKSENIKKLYRYYPDGNLKEMIEYNTQNDSILHQYEYDKAGNKVQEIIKQRMDHRLKKYQHNTNGVVIAKTEYLIVKDDTILYDKVEYKYGPDNWLDYKDVKNYLMIAMINQFTQTDSLKKYADIIEERYLMEYQVKHDYDDNGNLVKVWENRDAYSSDGSNMQSHYYKYNDSKQLIEDVIFYTSSGDSTLKRKYEYNSKGNLIREKLVNIKIKERVMEEKRLFYDSDDRLTEASIYYPDNRIDRRKYYYNPDEKLIKETSYIEKKIFLKQYRYKTF